MAALLSSGAMGPASIPYRLLQSALRALTPLVAGGRSKLARGLAGRRDAHARLVAWAEERRDPSRPCLWFHAPSVGEGLQARAVIEALRRRSPEAQVVYTHFSPSAEPLAAGMRAHCAGYLPWDLVSTVGPVLDALHPDCVVFTKTEVWPVLVSEAARRGIRCALVGGTVPPGAGRARWPARALLRTTWRRLDVVGAISGADRDGFAALGVRPEALVVTGDPGIDSAAGRARAADPAAPYLDPFHRHPSPTVVAGSTWPSDEEVLLPALEDARARVEEIRVIVAPHEPAPGHVSALIERLGSAGWRPATLSEVERSGIEGRDAVVVDRVGVLAHLYTVATVAYVGGGFHDAGLHSVLEPAAAGVAMAFGPRHRNARAAGDLLEVGGARVVGGRAGLADAFTTWLIDPHQRDYAGRAALDYIGRHAGAAERSAALLLDLVHTAPGTE